MNLTLTRAPSGEYSYAGELQGKAVGGKFRTRDPHGLWHSELVIRELGQESWHGKALERTTEEYLPSADPTRPIAVRYHRLQNDPDNRLGVTMPGMEAALERDAAGGLARFTARVCKREMVFKRVSEGKP